MDIAKSDSVPVSVILIVKSLIERVQPLPSHTFAVVNDLNVKHPALQLCDDADDARLPPGSQARE